MRNLPIGLALLVAAAAVFGQPADDREQSVAAFKQIAQVMRSPRCMNCHTTTDPCGLTFALTRTRRPQAVARRC
jgi:mono/diheme cytochrome c family protein